MPTAKNSASRPPPAAMRADMRPRIVAGGGPGGASPGRRRDLLGGGVGGDEVVVERAHAHRALHERAQARADEVVGVLGDALGDDVAADAVGVVARVQRLRAATLGEVGRGQRAVGDRALALCRRLGRLAEARDRQQRGRHDGRRLRRVRRAVGAAASLRGVLRLELARRVLWVHRCPSLIARVTAPSSSRSSPRRSARRPSSRSPRARRCAARSG